MTKRQIIIEMPPRPADEEDYDYLSAPTEIIIRGPRRSGKTVMQWLLAHGLKNANARVSLEMTDAPETVRNRVARDHERAYRHGIDLCGQIFHVRTD